MEYPEVVSVLDAMNQIDTRSLADFLANRYQEEHGDFVLNPSRTAPDGRFHHYKRFCRAVSKAMPIVRQNGQLDGRSYAARCLQDNGISLSSFHQTVSADDSKAFNKLYHSIADKRAQAALRVLAAVHFFGGNLDCVITESGTFRGHAEAVWYCVRDILSKDPN
eukprot:m.368959 g.368959  ORF g.368959 m.368959 type:complete len:164 (+) comp47068_c0_seq1:133-624(+)